MGEAHQNQDFCGKGQCHTIKTVDSGVKHVALVVGKVCFKNKAKWVQCRSHGTNVVLPGVVIALFRGLIFVVAYFVILNNTGKYLVP